MRLNNLPIYKGAGKPVNLYCGTHKIAGWRDAYQSGPDLTFDHTYNDQVGVLAQGRSVQPVDYYREAASAGVIQITDHKEDHLRGCRVDTVAAQAGSGDPSPDNVRPITGYAAVKVIRRGNNLWQPRSATTIGGMILSYDADGYYVLNGTTSAVTLFSIAVFLPPGTYRLSLGNTAAIGTTTDTTVQLRCRQVPTAYAPTVLGTVVNAVSPTTNVSGYINQLDIRCPAGITLVNYRFRPQLELGSIATLYTPYTGTDYALPCQQTIYGLTGAPDCREANGNEVHRTALATLTGANIVSLSAPSASAALIGVRANIPLAHYGTPCNVAILAICDKLRVTSADANYLGATGICGAIDGSVLRIFLPYTLIGGSSADTDATKLVNIRAWLTANPIQVLYQRATPLVLSNTPQTIALGDGLNNVYADVGTLNLSYQVSDGSNIAGDIASPTPTYPAAIISSQGTVRAQDQAGARYADLALPVLRAIPASAGGWLARDTVETVNGRLIHTRRVDPAIDGNTTTQITDKSQYVLATPIVTDLGPADLPSYYRHTRVITTGDYPPDVTAGCKVVDTA